MDCFCPFEARLLDQGDVRAWAEDIVAAPLGGLPLEPQEALVAGLVGKGHQVVLNKEEDDN